MFKTIEQKTLKFILENELLWSGDNVLVALSGGPDSVFLFYFLNKYRRRLKINLACFHLNHNLRGTESKRDEEFCRDLVAGNNSRFFISSKNVELFAKRNGISIEEAGREIRYKELSKCAKKYNYNKIATAHHSNDNSETILLNIIKGAGIKGLTGIPVKRHNIIRPLLCLLKDEIIDYLDKKKVTYCTDSSNLNDDYQRNYLRNEIIPLVKNKLNPQFESAILRMSGVIKDLSDFIDIEIRRIIHVASDFNNNELRIKLEEIKKLNTNLHGEFFKVIVNQYFRIDLDHQNIIDLKKLATKEAGKKNNLGGKLIAVKEREYILITANVYSGLNKDSVYLLPGQTKEVYDNKVSISKVNKSSISFDHSSNREYISADKINGRFLLRKWKNGDRFFPLGLKHSKKVSDFLNENKIETYMKKEHLVLLNSGNILWVVGLRIDDRYKVTKRTKKVLELCLN